MKFTEGLTIDFENDADRRMSSICRIMILLLIIVMLLNRFHVFKISNTIYPTLLISMVILFVPTILYDFMHLRSKFTRYFVLTLVVMMAGVLYSILSYHVIIMLVFPVVVACLYCDKKSVLFTAILSVPVMVASHLIALHLKNVPDEPLVTLYGVLVYGVLPRVIELFAITVICCSITEKLQRLINDLIEKNNDLYADQQTLVTSLAELVEAQSRETGQHVKRVAAYTDIFCHALGLSDEETWKVSVASMMHDVGKISVPQDILNKPSKLTEAEFSEVKKHVDYGYKLLHNSPGEIMQIAAHIAQEHHERFDGTGYQKQLKGEEINLYARCVAIADVFDALVSKRHYKDEWDPQRARAEIVSQAGRQFDPKLVELFDSHFDEFLDVMSRYPEQ
ncbi:MAG: HD domain-containing protein [Clostridiales bacterium]|nr:HD domain-containing protein [Clostridiales bacterium]